MSTPTIPTGAHGICACHTCAGVGGPNSVDTQSSPASHLGPGVDGPSPTSQSGPGAGGPHSHDAHPADDGQAAPGVVGSTPTEPPTRPPEAIVDAAARSAPTPPGPPISSPAARFSAACPEASTPSAAPKGHSPAILDPASLADPLLALSADVLDDLERVRISNENRLRQLTRTATDVDGEERGHGLTEDHPDVERLAKLVAALVNAEHDAVLNLNRVLRAHPLGPWVKAHKGVGEKQAARLLASIGDPAWNDAAGTWRTVRQLYTYCGYGDAAAQVRRRGERSNWDPNAKMRAYLVIDSCKQVLRKPCAKPDGQAWAEHVEDCRCSPYRLVYDDGRRKYADALHDEPCKRCGPSGHPAEPGTPLSAGHQQARAYRLASKALLKDLWREAHRLHGFDDEEADS